MEYFFAICVICLSAVCMFSCTQSFISTLPTAPYHRNIVERALLAIIYSSKVLNTVELQWLEHFWDHENMFETGVVQANEG